MGIKGNLKGSLETLGVKGDLKGSYGEHGWRGLRGTSGSQGGPEGVMVGPLGVKRDQWWSRGA